MSVPVKGADERDPVVGIWSLPASGISMAEDIVIVAEQLLTTRNILERDTVRISQHVVEHHKGSRATPAGFAMEMRPAVFRKRPDGEDESIHFLIEGTRMIGNSKAHVCRVVGRNNFAFRTSVLDSHILGRA